MEFQEVYDCLLANAQAQLTREGCPFPNGDYRRLAAIDVVLNSAPRIGLGFYREVRVLYFQLSFPGGITRRRMIEITELLYETYRDLSLLERVVSEARDEGHGLALKRLEEDATKSPEQYAS